MAIYREQNDTTSIYGWKHLWGMRNISNTTIDINIDFKVQHRASFRVTSLLVKRTSYLWDKYQIQGLLWMLARAHDDVLIADGRAILILEGHQVT